MLEHFDTEAQEKFVLETRDQEDLAELVEEITTGMEPGQVQDLAHLLFRAGRSFQAAQQDGHLRIRVHQSKAVWLLETLLDGER